MGAVEKGTPSQLTLDQTPVVEGAQTAEVEGERAEATPGQSETDVASRRSRRLGLRYPEVRTNHMRRMQVSPIEHVGAERRPLGVLPDDQQERAGDQRRRR